MIMMMMMMMKRNGVTEVTMNITDMQFFWINKISTVHGHDWDADRVIGRIGETSRALGKPDKWNCKTFVGIGHSEFYSSQDEQQVRKVMGILSNSPGASNSEPPTNYCSVYHLSTRQYHNLNGCRLTLFIALYSNYAAACSCLHFLIFFKSYLMSTSKANCLQSP